MIDATTVLDCVVWTLTMWGVGLLMWRAGQDGRT